MRASSLMFGLAALAVVGLAWAGSRPRPRHERPLPLGDEGPSAEATLRGPDGRVLLFNFRTVEQGLLYRASALAAEALKDETTFRFLRERDVRTVLVLAEDEHQFYAEEGYFRYWAERSGHRIGAVWVPVAAKSAYTRDERSGLRAAAMLLSLMRSRRPADGAVLVHGEAGKDGTGIVAAAYELSRNWGWVERDTLWGQVMAHYLGSNRILRRHEGAATPARCADGQSAFVCPEWLAALRRDLEYVVQL